jgi:hypothetical protein
MEFAELSSILMDLPSGAYPNYKDEMMAWAQKEFGKPKGLPS